MGLTRARAYQIFDIDYKQAVRVITLTNITLSGGAPSTVDGVNLAQDDRVLVAGQGIASQNGIYIVTSLGTGSNGTWTRAVDGNQTGEIQAGMIVMVTEGNTYDDTQWKLTTDDPITVGVTSLTFEQVGATLAGNFLPTANATYTLGNATQQWKSLYVSGNTIYVGDSTITSNAVGVSLTSPGGAVFTVSGTSAANTIGSFGIVSATGNIIGNYILGNAAFMSGIPTSYGNANVVANLAALGTNPISTSGTITGGNITGSNFLTGGLISATATITGGNLQTGGTISASGNITGGNILGGANVNATTHTGTTVSVSSSITGGNLFTGGEISAAGRIQGANIIGANITTSGLISATGSIVGNVANIGSLNIQGYGQVINSSGVWTGSNSGLQGATGAQGTTGTGTQGATGTQGTTGTGTQGATGAQGTTGTGTQGATGTQGTTGTGTQGATGTGTQGATGAQGTTGTGTQGATGAQGTTGTGTQGATGAQGTTGTNGSQGATGAQGTTGTTGATGSQGTTGTQGIAGAQGTTGTQGTTGATGTQGTTGATGAQGTTGATGAQGTTGTQGTTGSTGTQGATGATGAQGTSGTNGSQGATGATGAQGTSGTNGSQGATGATGAQGTTGATGTQGTTGATGTQGTTGATGTQGTTGTTGSAGAQGTAGTNGTQGTTGTTGSAGAQGTAGTQGASGSPWGGGTFTGGISGTSALFNAGVADVSGTGSALRMLSPGGGSYATSNSATTGAIKIKLPVAANNSSTMLRFRVTIFEYSEAGAGRGTSRTFELGGYNYAGGSWYNCFATQLTAGGGDLNVRWGTDATSDCIWIGETATSWAYVQVYVTDFQGGYSNYGQTTWDDGWSISFAAALDTVEVGPIVAARVFHGQTSNLPAADNTYNLGAAGTRFATVYGVTFSGVSTTAKYADLAEKYVSDTLYEPGTVLSFGGPCEVTQSTYSHDTSVAGVVSTDPAYLMNAEAEGTTVPVAMTGRVPCRVQGPINKGDLVVTSDLPGVAQKIDNTKYSPGCVIGKSLESINNDIVQTIEVVVGRF